MWQWGCIKCIFGHFRHFVCMVNIKRNFPVTVHPFYTQTARLKNDNSFGSIHAILEMALCGWPESSLKSCISQVHRVHNMFSAEPDNSGYRKVWVISTHNL